MKTEQNLNVSDIVSMSPDVMHGTPCFAGTRVPVRTLLDYLAEGDTVDAFLTNFSTAKREQATGLLALAQECLFDSPSR